MSWKDLRNLPECFDLNVLPEDYDMTESTIPGDIGMIYMMSNEECLWARYKAIKYNIQSVKEWHELKKDPLVDMADWKSARDAEKEREKALQKEQYYNKYSDGYAMVINYTWDDAVYQAEDLVGCGVAEAMDTDAATGPMVSAFTWKYTEDPADSNDKHWLQSWHFPAANFDASKAGPEDGEQALDWNIESDEVWQENDFFLGLMKTWNCSMPEQNGTTWSTWCNRFLPDDEWKEWDTTDTRFSSGDAVTVYAFQSSTALPAPTGLMASSDPTTFASFDLVLAGATTIAASMAGVMAATLAF